MAIQKQEKKYPVKLTAAIILIFVVISLAVVGTSVISDVNSVNIREKAVIVISDGWGINKIAEKLTEEKIIKYPFIFELKAKQMGVDSKVRPGVIEIESNMSYDDILGKIASDSDSYKITIPEGYEIRQIADLLEEQGLINREEFYNKLDPQNYDYKFLEDIPERENALEGYLYPATYNFTPLMTEQEIIDKMLSTFDEHFTEEFYDRAEEMGKTVDEIVTLASIVERESGDSEERNKIAGVFYNRLETDMKLQSCATVQYILQERKEVLSTQDTKIESPYNTYKNDGLPVGPIASPGIESIEAALYPEETDALYFVLGSDGKHIFSASYEEHIQAKESARR